MRNRSTQPQTGAQILVSTLEKLGVTTLFGIPGIHNLDVYDALLDSPIRHITGRNESGVAFMADGYARETGVPGVALVISGPGLTNSLTALGEARHDSVPLLLISSDIPRHYRNGSRGYLHQLESPTTMTSSVTKERIRVEEAVGIEETLAYAYRLTTSGRPGPVHVEIPIDVLQETTEEAIALEEVLSIFRNAPRRYIIAGGGAAGAHRELLAFARRWGTPVVTTAAGKGVIPETDPLSLGGRLHIGEIRREIESADAVMVVGSQLSSTDLWTENFTPRGKVIAINVEAAHLFAVSTPAAALRMDAAAVLKALLKASPSDGIDERRYDETVEHVASLRRAATAALPAVLGQPDTQVDRMRTVLEQISAALSDDGGGEPGILTADMTTIAYCAISEYATRRTGGFLHPAGFGTLGYALPAAIGVAARADRPRVVALAGDGGVQFTLQELAVAVQEKLSIPIVIWNDRGYGEIRREEEIRHPGRRIAVDNLGPDFIALARSYGAAGERVSDIDLLHRKLEEAMHREGPTVLEIEA